MQLELLKLAPAWIKEFVEIQVSIELGLTLKRLRDMIRTHSEMHCTDKYSEQSSILEPVWLNG